MTPPPQFNDPRKKWAEQGHLGADERPHDHFGYDIQTCWPFNRVAGIDCLLVIEVKAGIDLGTY